MKHLVLILLLCATGTAVQAAEDRSALFACGINFGGKQLTFAPQSESKPEKDYEVKNQRLLHVMGAARPETLHFIQPARAESSRKEKRLPPKFTFAIVGCSWR